MWERRTLRLQAGELTQVVLGFAVPILLAHHVVATRISEDFFGANIGYYTFILWVYFVRSPEQGVLQMVTLVVAWTHAMFGLHFWLRVRPWYARVHPAAAGRRRAGAGAVVARRDRSRAAGRRARRRSGLEPRRSSPICSCRRRRPRANST